MIKQRSIAGYSGYLQRDDLGRSRPVASSADIWPAAPKPVPARMRRARRRREPQTPSFPVVTGAGPHPFPFRTRKLRLLPPMVLRAQVRGRVGRCRVFLVGPMSSDIGPFSFSGSSPSAENATPWRFHSTWPSLANARPSRKRSLGRCRVFLSRRGLAPFRGFDFEKVPDPFCVSLYRQLPLRSTPRPSPPAI